MPAFAHEVDEALTAGVRFEFLAAPVAAKGGGKVEELILERMKLGDLGPDGRREPVRIEGSRFVFPCDCVVLATGGILDREWLQRSFGLAASASGRIAVSPATLMTAAEGVFAGGDLVHEKGLVVESVSDGRRAASAIAEYLEAAS
jgi:NADPH-dependent glutamate synthase beta subunit-like oxidoreductase